MEVLFARLYSFLNQGFEKPIARVIPRWITPNMVTLFRVILAVPVLTCLFLDLTYVALAIYIFAALLDYVDGLLARGRNQITDLGKFLDAITDKIFLMILAVPITSIIFANNGADLGLTNSTLFCLVIAHMSVETLLAAKRIEDFWQNYVEHDRPSRFKPELAAVHSGKIKFVLQSIGLGAMILAYPSAENAWTWVAIACLVIALPFAVRSYIHKKNPPSESR